MAALENMYVGAVSGFTMKWYFSKRVFGLAQPILAPLKAVWRGVEVFFLGYPGICPRQAREKAPVQGAPPPVHDATPQGDTRQWAVSTTPTAVRPLVFFFFTFNHVQGGA